MKLKTMILASSLALTAATQSQAQSAQDLMTPETLWQMGRIGSVAVAPDGKRLLLSVTHYDKVENKGTSRLYTTTFNPQKSAKKADIAQVEALGRGSSAAYIDGGRRLAYMVGDKLYVADLSADFTPKASLEEAGAARLVAEGIDGFLFSPDARRVIVVRMVPTTASIAAKDADLPKASGMVINDLMYKHWDHYVTEVPHPFVADFDGTQLTGEVDMLAGEPFECPMEPFGGVEQLAWSPDGNSIAYTCRKLTGVDYAISTDSDIYLYDVLKHRTVKNLCKPEGYVAPQKDRLHSLEAQAANGAAEEMFVGYDQNPQFSPDGHYVAWLSMARDGYESDRQRLCLYDLRSGEHRFLTEDFESGVDEFLWTADSKKIYFTGVWHGKTNLHVSDLSGRTSQLTDEQADFSLCALTPDGKSLIVKRHSMQYPDDIYSVCTREGTSTRLTAVNADIYKTLAVGDVRERWVKTSDGKDMLCWVIYPPAFDATKTYPALLFCEGGPQSPVSQFWSYRWNFQIMAAQGYIVIAPNRRGLPGFGMEWLEEISGDYTGQCMRDYLSAIDDLAREPYVDAERLGAVGASFGGFSVYWLAGHHEGRFKALIAHDGIYNTQQQYVETEEMWFPNWDLGSAPWLKAADGQMQKAYRESPHLYVDRWTAPILCIHGQRDFRIEYTQAESAFNAARLRGLDAQLLLFPDENHWVLKPQNGILWQRTFFRFLDKYLKK